LPPPSRPAPPAGLAIIAMGVSGSGKSTLGALLAASWTARSWKATTSTTPRAVAKMSAGQPLDDDDRWPWLDRLGQAVGQALASRGRVVAACSALRRSYRERLRAPSRRRRASCCWTPATTSSCGGSPFARATTCPPACWTASWPPGASRRRRGGLHARRRRPARAAVRHHPGLAEGRRALERRRGARLRALAAFDRATDASAWPGRRRRRPGRGSLRRSSRARASSRRSPPAAATARCRRRRA
jgi:hypothetical protein